MEWPKLTHSKLTLQSFNLWFLELKMRELLMSISIKLRLKTKKEVNLLGIKIDKELTFKSHIGGLCRGASKKLDALRRIWKVLTAEKAKLLANAFISREFN